MSGRGGWLEVASRDRILTVRLQNPGRANALDDRMLAELPLVLTGPAAERSLAVVLTGGGDRVFSAGVALPSADVVDPVAVVRRREAALSAAAAAVERCPRPVIGALNGSAMGGGLELAAACEWRVAASGASFGMPPARLGVVYLPQGLRRFVGLVGPAVAAELFLTARPIDADRACAVGLVNEVLAPEAVWGRALDLAGAVAELAPVAVAGTRAILRALASGADAAAVDAVAHPWRELAYGSTDMAEGLAAFTERRAARFTGR